MSTTEWLVMGGGLAVIIWLNWYFLFAERGKSRGAASTHAASEIPPRNPPTGSRPDA